MARFHFYVLAHVRPRWNCSTTENRGSNCRARRTCAQLSCNLMLGHNSFAKQAWALWLFHPKPTLKDILAIRPRPSDQTAFDYIALAAVVLKAVSCVELE